MSDELTTWGRWRSCVRGLLVGALLTIGFYFGQGFGPYRPAPATPGAFPGPAQTITPIPSLDAVVISTGHRVEPPVRLRLSRRDYLLATGYDIERLLASEKAATTTWPRDRWMRHEGDITTEKLDEMFDFHPGEAK